MKPTSPHESFLMELVWLSESRVEITNCEARDYLSDSQLPKDQQIYIDHDTLLAVARARNAENVAALARIKRLLEKHKIPLPS